MLGCEYYAQVGGEKYLYIVTLGESKPSLFRQPFQRVLVELWRSGTTRKHCHSTRILFEIHLHSVWVTSIGALHKSILLGRP